MNSRGMKSIDTLKPATGSYTGRVLQETYTLGACIGQGGMGEVYEATHARLPGRMAVKILQPHLRTNEEAFARFCREAEIMSTVQHPHIIQVFDFNTSPALDGLPYFVMEYLDGVDLERRLAESGPLSLAATLRIVDAVASALGAAHAAGVVHRDLKPANIFLMRGEGPGADFVKVIDFGISKARDSDPHLSNVSEVVGTPAFMSPEQALGRMHTIDARTDQFALAAITYTMLAGRPPFVGADAVSLLYQVIHEPHPPLSEFVSWDTTAIQPVLDRALRKRQEDRYEGVVEFARALSAAAGLSTDDLQPEAVEPPPRVRAPVVAEPPVPEPRALRPRTPVTPFDDADLPPSIDRIPHGPQRTVVLALAVLGLAAFIAHKGMYRGLGGRVVAAEQHLRQLAGETWRSFRKPSAVPAPEATPLPKEHPPTAETVPPPAPLPATKDAVAVDDDGPRPQAAARHDWARHVRPSHNAAPRSGWQSIEITSQPAAPPTEDVAPTPSPAVPVQPAPPAPDEAPIPAAPAPAPAAPELAPAAQ
jgi:serine/threonine-protein kinase